jgi:hypothetical protein
MKRLKWLLVIAIAVVAFLYYRSHAAPSAREVESALRVYLSSPDSQNCSGSMTLEQLDDVRLGEYTEQFGGWPVYAAHRETCHEVSRSAGYSLRSWQSYDGRHDGERNVAVAFVRRSVTGQVEVFEPALFRDGERQVRETIQKSLENIRFNVQSSSTPAK